METVHSHLYIYEHYYHSNAYLAAVPNAPTTLLFSRITYVPDVPAPSNAY